MYLIVGLGNPEEKYNFTRHNFGFLALDFYFKKNNLSWEKKEKFNSTWQKSGDKIFIKPKTYYNDSGLAVRAFLDFYKIPEENLLVLCDDFNIPFGTLRFRKNGSSGGNNGLKSIETHLSSSNFPRLRLGTGNDELRKKIGDTDFVLSKFLPEEKEALPNFLNEISARLDELN